MTLRKTLGFLTGSLTALSLVVGSAAFVATTVAPDIAVAKSDKSNGGNSNKGGNSGKSKSASSNGGGKSKSASSNGGGNSKSHKSKGRDQSKSRAKTNGSSSNNAFSKFGQDVQRGVGKLFGGSKQKPVNTTKHTKAHVRQPKPLEKSLRPVARVRQDGSAQNPDIRKGGKRYRDPLVTAITDPEGSDKLRNLNASKAAAPAFRNAAANSNVGLIATYQAAATEYYTLREDVASTGYDLRKLNESYNGRDSNEIIEDITTLDPSAPGYESDLEDLTRELALAETYEESRDALIDELKEVSRDTRDALWAAEDAFFDASKGRTLTRESLSDFHRNLDLPNPETNPRYDTEVTPHVSEGMVNATVLTKPGYSIRKGGKRYRDPLVAAITDPDGSDKLRNLNASKAAAPAFRNAAGNSNVGMIATYQTKATEYYTLREGVASTRYELRKLDESYDGRDSNEIIEDITALDPSAPDYESDLEDLTRELALAETYEESRDALIDELQDSTKATLIASKEAEHAFYEASKGSLLTLETLAELHENLDLPAPLQ